MMLFDFFACTEVLALVVVLPVGVVSAMTVKFLVNEVKVIRD